MPMAKKSLSRNNRKLFKQDEKTIVRKALNSTKCLGQIKSKLKLVKICYVPYFYCEKILFDLPLHD